jgi:predicted pyridoxine 5'-phosphate oxidase superfamily flavin-nucleotide-binding protein
MAIPGWTREESPFHAGERAIQARLGAEEQMQQVGRRAIREFLPEQHRQFYAQLPYALVGTVDPLGNPWASMLWGKRGFFSSPSDRILRVNTQPIFGDPLATTLAEGIDIGFLGIELPTRRRNRVNGVVTSVDASRFTVAVRQAFGNCPKYIQSRTVELEDCDPSLPRPIYELSNLGESERSQILKADTFFIATGYQDASAGAASGVDVSHRGGKPGFVRIDDSDTLTIPDFAGNCHFNTFGNIELNPRAGLLFIDFETGDLLYLTGTAEVIWEGAEISRYEGAERLFRLRVTQGYRVEGGLPLHWSNPEYSPFLDRTGPWEKAE